MTGQPHKLAIIACHWNICRPLGLPSPADSTEPLPSLLATPDPELRVAVEEGEEEEEEWPSDEETSEEWKPRSTTVLLQRFFVLPLCCSVLVCDTLKCPEGCAGCLDTKARQGTVMAA